MSWGVPLRKTLILLSFLLVAAILWPIHVGIQVEKLLREDRVLSVSGLELHHFVLDYQRNHYWARAVSRVRVSRQNIDVWVDIEHDIRHRLLGVSIESRLAGKGIDAVRDRPLRAALLGAEPKGESWVGLGGKVMSRISSKPVQLPDGPDPERTGSMPFLFEVGAIYGGFSYSRERAVLSLDTERLRLSNGRATLELDELHHTVLAYHPAGAPLSHWPDYDHGFGVGRVSLVYDTQDWLEARSLKVASWKSPTGEGSHTTMRLRGDGVRIAGFPQEHMDLYLCGTQWPIPDQHRPPCDWAYPTALGLPAAFRSELHNKFVPDGIRQANLRDAMLEGRLRLSTAPDQQLDIDWVLGFDNTAQTRSSLDALRLAVEVELSSEVIDGLQAILDSMGAEDTLGRAGRKWLDQATAGAWLPRDTGVRGSLFQVENGRMLVNGEDTGVTLPVTVSGFLESLQ